MRWGRGVRHVWPPLAILWAVMGCQPAPNRRAADLPPPFRLERDAAIEGPFGKVAGVALDRHGRLHVLDQLERRIDRYGRDGQPVGSYGGPGAGPGELGAGASAIIRGSGDTMIVLDATNRRLVLYLDDGTPAGTIRLDYGRGIPVRLMADAEGRPIAQIRRIPRGRESTSDSTDYLVRYDAAGEPSDTLTALGTGSTMRFERGLPQITIFGAEPVWTVRADGRPVTGTTDVSALTVGTGPATDTIPPPPTSVPVNDADREIVRKAFVRTLAHIGMGTAAEHRRAAREIEFAPRIPEIVRAFAMPDTTVWVARPDAPSKLPKSLTSDWELNQEPLEEDFLTTRWDVVRPDGSVWGSLRLPPRSMPVAAARGAVWLLRHDADGVEHLERFRIVARETK